MIRKTSKDAHNQNNNSGITGSQKKTLYDMLDRLTKLGVDVSQKKIVSGMMQWAENFNRKVTFKAAFGSRIRQLKKQTK